MDGFICETEETLEFKAVYDCLQDEKSKEIYIARSLYSLTNNVEYLRNIVRDMPIAKYMYEQLNKHANQEFVLFGAGKWGRHILKFFPEINWKYIIDNKRVGEKLNNYDIISFEELKKLNNTYIVISICFEYEEVVQQLIEAGFLKENILVLGEKVVEFQYFDLPELKLAENEVFVDVGAFDGKTSFRFSEVTKNRYKKIYLFEPNRTCYKKCQCRMFDKDCVLISKGVSDEARTVLFYENAEGSRIVNEGEYTNKIETVSLDEYFGETKITYLKMDIEGEELMALKGCEKILRRDRPKLAISVYHTRTDIWKIPTLLLKYNPNYKFYLRIYSFTGNDTILYAI